jgi:3-oxoacyl-[acyl-carrier-protein] synthase I
VESAVIANIFGTSVPCSSTKHLTGHTLGAAGITEAILAWLILERDLPLPVQPLHADSLDPELPACGLLLQPARLKQRRILSNSFAFGGNNTCLIIGAADA